MGLLRKQLPKGHGGPVEMGRPTKEIFPADPILRSGLEGRGIEAVVDTDSMRSQFSWRSWTLTSCAPPWRTSSDPCGSFTRHPYLQRPLAVLVHLFLAKLLLRGRECHRATCFEGASFSALGGDVALPVCQVAMSATDLPHTAPTRTEVPSSDPSGWPETRAPRRR